MLGGAVVGWFSDVAEVCVLMSCLRVTSLSDGEASGVCCGGAVLNQDTAEDRQTSYLVSWEEAPRVDTPSWENFESGYKC